MPSTGRAVCDPASKVLTDARRRLVERGWWQGGACPPGGGEACCLLAAVSHSCWGREDERHGLDDQAVRRLAAAAGFDGDNPCLLEERERLADYNDHPPRRLEDVLNLFDAALAAPKPF